MLINLSLYLNAGALLNGKIKKEKQKQINKCKNVEKLNKNHRIEFVVKKKVSIVSVIEFN